MFADSLYIYSVKSTSVLFVLVSSCDEHWVWFPKTIGSSHNPYEHVGKSVLPGSNATSWIIFRLGSQTCRNLEFPESQNLKDMKMYIDLILCVCSTYICIYIYIYIITSVIVQWLLKSPVDILAKDVRLYRPQNYKAHQVKIKCIRGGPAPGTYFRCGSHADIHFVPIRGLICKVLPGPIYANTFQGSHHTYTVYM